MYATIFLLGLTPEGDLAGQRHCLRPTSIEDQRNAPKGPKRLMCAYNPHLRKPSWYRIMLNETAKAAEFGIDVGRSTLRLAETFEDLYLFDFDWKIKKVRNQVLGGTRAKVINMGSTDKARDSYTYSLKSLLHLKTPPAFDYVYLDAAHEWHHDGYAFLLLDRLLKPGGIIEFDDYSWSLAASPTSNPKANPKILDVFTQAQIEEPQVKEVVDLLVKTNVRYQAIVPNRMYRKLSDDVSYPASAH